MKIFSTQPCLILTGLCLFLTLGINAQEKPRKTIDQAINQGVEWLKGKQIKDGVDKGSWGPVGKNLSYSSGRQTHHIKIGITALALYALLACDVHPKDQAIINGFNFLENNLMKKPPMDTINYERAVVLLALEALADARAKKKKAREVGRIIFLLPNQKKLIKTLVEWLESVQSPKGGWRYGPPFPSPGGFDEDISQTQIVLLGLKAASRLGVKVNKTTFLKALKYNLNQQETNGPIVRRIIGKDKNGTQMSREDMARGWAYINPGMYGSKQKLPPNETQATGGMTTAGICSLIICKSELKRLREFTKKLRERTERGINDGLAWLETYYTITTNPGRIPDTSSWDYYYYLYGLERVGMLGNISHIGSHNWYLDGAQVVTQKQYPEGYWMNGKWFDQGADLIDTSFALLFLEKATKPILTK